jgi:hypothetical protein
MVASGVTPAEFARAAVGDLAYAKALHPLASTARGVAGIVDIVRGTAYSPELDNIFWPDKPGLHSAVLHWVRPQLKKLLAY